jgi:hypothetical protein
VPRHSGGPHAVEVLERIGTPAARKLLEELHTRLNDPEVKEDIEATLARLRGKP